MVQEGVPAAIPAEACYLGWQESLILLGKLVEAESPDQPERLEMKKELSPKQRDELLKH